MPYADIPRLDSTLASPVYNELEQYIHYLYMIVYPIIFFVGLIGNLLSSLLFSITELNQTSCGTYFLLLAIADSIALIGGLHHCLTIGYHVPVPNASYCRARNFISYTSMDIASWMVVAISIDRYVKVKFPIKARIYCTQRLTKMVSSILVVFFMLKNVHLSTAFIGDFTETAADRCGPNSKYPTYVAFFQNIWPWIDLTTFALLPFIIVTLCNSFIIYNQYQRRLRLGRRNLDRSLAKFLLISSFSFMIGNFPVSIAIVLVPYISTNYGKKQSYDEVSFVFDVLRLPSYVSLAFNFYLYYYSSSLFRQQVVLLFRRIFRIQSKQDHDHTEMERTMRRHCQEHANPNEVEDQ